MKINHKKTAVCTPITFEEIIIVMINRAIIWQHGPLIPTAHPQCACTSILIANRIVAGLETHPVYDFGILAFTFRQNVH